MDHLGGLDEVFTIRDRHGGRIPHFNWSIYRGGNFFFFFFLNPG